MANRKAYEFTFLVRVNHVNPQLAFNRISMFREQFWNMAQDTDGFHNGEQQITQVRQANQAEVGVWDGLLPKELNIAAPKRVLRRFKIEPKPKVKRKLRRFP